MSWWRRRPSVDEGPATWTWPYRGTVVWLTAEEGGRVSGPPRPSAERDFYAANGFVPPHTLQTGQASFVLRGFDPELMASPPEARWLVSGLGDFQTTEPGAVVVVTEGARTVAQFLVHEMDDDTSSV